jgi:hypothetical protein
VNTWAGGAAIALVFVWFAADEMHGQDVQPRVYTPAPVGVNLATVGYSYSNGAVLFDKTIPIEDAVGSIHSIAAGYSRSVGIAGMASRIDVVQPFVTGQWEGLVQGEHVTTSRTGFADPTLRLVLGIIGAPALSLSEFAEFEPKTVVGATVRVRFPFGQYDPDRLVNLGSNRWMFSPQIGVSQMLSKFLIEAYAGAWIFTDNGDFFGGRTLSQDPLYAFQVHVGYRFRRGLWLAASSRQSLGGQVSIDGGEKQSFESNNRIGITIAVPLGPRYGLKLAGTVGTTSTAGNDYDSVAALCQATF